MIAGHKGEIPFLVLLLPFLAGIGLAIYSPSFSPVATLSFTFYILAVLFTGLNLAYKQLNLYKFKWFGGMLIHGILFVLGWLVTLNYNELSSKEHFARKKSDYLLVKVNNEPVVKNGILRLTASVDYSVLNRKRIPASGNLLIAIKDSAAKSLYYGDELLIPANYSPVELPYNPAEFNYKQYLANQNIHYQEFLYAGQYYLLSRNNGNSLIAFSLRLRQQLVEKFKQHMHSPEAIAVASTLILGYKADLSNDVLQAYSKTGTIHVLSVSGAHVAILLVMLNFALSFLNKFKYGKTIKAILIISIIWYYSLLTGFSPAVCRAAVMISMIIIGKTYSRYINTLNILAISAFFLLLYNPYFIADVGFQLSYLAVFGLVVLQPVVYNWMDIKNKWADKLWALCSVSLAAQVITFPLSAFYFHQFPVYFLVSNLFIVIPSAIIMYSGIAYLLLPDIPYVSSALAWALEKSILLMNNVLAAIEHFPYSGINKIWITTTEYLLLYAIIISVFYFFYERKVWLLQLCLVCTLLFACSIGFKRWNHSRSNHIAFLSLRKHAGIVFKTGNKAVILTDLSDTDKTYHYSVQPYLDSCQVNEIHRLPLNSNAYLSFFLKKNNLIQFQDKKILLFDGLLQGATLSQKLNVDYLYITGDPLANLNFISKYYNFGLLIMDNTNSNQLIASIQHQGMSQHTNFYVLQRNKSMVIPSNYSN